MLELVLIWTGLLIACLILARSRRGEGTLVLAYLLGLSLIHVPGAVNILGNVTRLPGAAESVVGFKATLIGMGAFLAGVLVVRLMLRGRAEVLERADHDNRLWRIGTLLLAAGVVAAFAFLPLAKFIPSVTSLTSAISLLLIIGYWMILKGAMNQQRGDLVALLLALMPIMPFATLLFGGFAGFGISWMIIVAAFWFCNARRVAAIVAFSPLALWAGVSLAVAYFEQRTQIREAVWVEQSGLQVRLERIGQIVESFEVYDFNNYRHVFWIDRRLNQNYLVGKGIERHEAGLLRLLHGSSVDPLALIPRAVWPDKPAVGGGGTLVSEFTGLKFDPYTSVGVGQPLEFYANFGWLGIVFGFFGLGGLLAWCDRGLSDGFKAVNLRKILVYGLPGIALIQPGGNLIEIVVAAAAAMIMARLTYWAINRWRPFDLSAGQGPATAR